MLGKTFQRLAQNSRLREYAQDAKHRHVCDFLQFRCRPSVGLMALRRFCFWLPLYRLSAVFLVAACTQQPPPPAVLTPDPLARSSEIALLPLEFDNPTFMPKPVAGSGAGAAEGAGQGAAISGAIAANPPQGGQIQDQVVIMAVGVILLPISTLFGTIAGALSAHPEEDVRAAHKMITAAYASERPSEQIRDRLIKRARSRAVCGLLAADPISHEPSVIELNALGTETALLIEVTYFGIGMRGSIDPDIIPYIGVEIRYLEAESGRLISRSGFHHVGDALDYFDAAAEGATLLKSEIARGYEGISDRIEQELLGNKHATGLDMLPIKRCEA